MSLRKALLQKIVLLGAVAVFATGFVQSSSGVAKATAGHDDSNHLCNFFPKNNLRYPITHAAGEMTEAEFNSILDVVQKFYGPVFTQLGFGQFNIERLWQDETVNAFADLGKNDSTGKPTRWIHMFGGLARDPHMSNEGFLLVACHEIGHHLGGYPRYGGAGNTWASDEGEADYYSTAKCARYIMSQLPSTQVWHDQHARSVDPTVSTQCDTSFPSDKVQSASCMRSSIAGLALANTLAALESPTLKVAFDKPDKSVVSSTFDGHPHAQCRLDTYFQAALCQKPVTERMGSGPNQGACEAPARGARPACWYKSVASK